MSTNDSPFIDSRFKNTQKTPRKSGRVWANLVELFLRKWVLQIIASYCRHRPGPTRPRALPSATAPLRALTTHICTRHRSCFKQRASFSSHSFCFSKQDSAQDSQTHGLGLKDSHIFALKVPLSHLGFDSNVTSSQAFPGHLWQSSTLSVGILLQVSHNIYHSLKLFIRLLTSVFLSPQE